MKSSKGFPPNSSRASSLLSTFISYLPHFIDWFADPTRPVLLTIMGSGSFTRATPKPEFLQRDFRLGVCGRQWAPTVAGSSFAKSHPTCGSKSGYRPNRVAYVPPYLFNDAARQRS